MIKLYEGDCLEIMKEIPSGSVNLIAVDPPYFMGMTHNGQKGVFNDLALCKPFFEELFREYNRILKDDGRVYFFTDWRGYAFYYPIFNRFIPARNLIVWDKKSGAGNKYNYQHEFIIYGTKKPMNQGGSNVWKLTAFSSGAQKTNGAKVHPTQKPVELMERIVSDGCEPGGVVLDSFMGSGSTGVACMNTGRKFIGIELDSDYFKIASDRIKEARKKADNELLARAQYDCTAATAEENREGHQQKAC